ncbi:hypothetical protein NHQ30_000858 [Ciborinia camelliae]|nr:hypothetical protein NHQ30_000858 [Ciborinia camelliae]
MAEALGVAASIAGLLSLADTVVRLGLKYIRDFKDAEKSVQSLVDEVNILAGILHSLSNVVQELEAVDSTSHGSYKIQHINSCQKTLEKIIKELENAIPEMKSISQKLKWPFKKGTIEELRKEVQGHKSTMNMAMSARQMQEQLNQGVAAINFNLETARLERGKYIYGCLISHRRLETVANCVPDETLRKRLNLLGTIDVQKWQNSNVRLRQPGTGVWFTDSKEFRDWKSTDHSKLWVYGIPGAGKTVLIASVIQEIEQTQDPFHGLAIFYCDYKDTQTHDPRTILGALARQLILQHEHAFTQLETFCEKYQMTEHTQGSATTEYFCELIVDLSNNFISTSIIVDGLDEVAGDRAEVARLLQSLNRPSGTIKTLFASRNEVDIRRVLTDYPSISIAATSGDLRLYVHSEIQKRTKAGKLRIQDPHLKDHIVKTLIEGADGITDRARREALRKLPPDLPKSYERILERVNRSTKENQALVRNTLIWVVCAVEPLTTTQLLQALAVRPGDKTFEEENMTTLDELLNWCSSLIRKKTQSDGLELAHFTVKEYLLSLDESCAPSLLQYRLSAGHTNIAKTCFAFLGLSEFNGSNTPIARLNIEPKDFMKTWWDFEDKYPVMEYILRYWIVHVHRSSWGEVADEVLLLFDESSSCYTLWTFGQYYSALCYPMEEQIKYQSLMALAKITGPLRPTALHWAAILALPDICTVLIRRGAPLNATSFIGSPIYCAMMMYKAIFNAIDVDLALFEAAEHFNWNWDSRKKAIEILIIEGVDINNIEDSKGHAHSIIELLYQNSEILLPDEDALEHLQLTYSLNPEISMQAVLAFVEYFQFMLDTAYPHGVFNTNEASQMINWGARTDFKYFASDTLPILFALILRDLVVAEEPTTELKCLFEVNFNQMVPGNDEKALSNILQGQSEDWTRKLKFVISQCIRTLNKTAPYTLERMVYRIIYHTHYIDSRDSFFILEILDAFLRNDIELDFNWRDTNDGGNTILHQIVQSWCMGSDNNQACAIIAKAVSQHGVDLTVLNDEGVTPIELLALQLEFDKQFNQIWVSGNFTSAFIRLPDLPKRLLHNAARNATGRMVGYVFDQLAIDGNTHWGLLQDFSARHCNADYMQKLFQIWLEDRARKHDVSTADEECSNDGSFIVKGSKEKALSFMENDRENGFSDVEEKEKPLSTQGLSERTHSLKNIKKALFISNSEETDRYLTVDERKYTDLHLLSGSHDPTDFGKLRILLAHSPDLEIRDGQNFTPLAIAIRSKNLRAMYALLMAGADVANSDDHGQTYLHLACCLGNKEAAKALLEAGADISIRDHRGETAKDIALLTGRSDLIDSFREAVDDTSVTEIPGINTFMGDFAPDFEFLDSVRLPPLLTTQDLALRPKLPQSLPGFRQTGILEL